jgi:hypothetical protein
MKVRGNKRGGKRHHKAAVAAVVLGALVSFQAGAARADDTAAEIRMLKTRLKQLEERVAEQGRKEKETQAQIRHAAAQPGPRRLAHIPTPSGSAFRPQLAVPSPKDWRIHRGILILARPRPLFTLAGFPSRPEVSWSWQA